MSGVVKQVGKLFGGNSSREGEAAFIQKGIDKQKQFIRAELERQGQGNKLSMTPEEQKQTEEQKQKTGLRRRRGTRSLLSDERINAESGLGGDQTTLGG